MSLVFVFFLDVAGKDLPVLAHGRFNVAAGF
jgi:hypothetical protein